jgi:hypothetical protein
MSRQEAGLPDYMKAAAKSIHPSDEEWVSYHRGLVTTAERARMAEHLAADCAECRAVLDDVRGFFDEPSVVEVAPVMGSELKAAVFAAPKVIALPSPPPRRPAFQWAWPIAAAVALGVGGLTWRAQNAAAREQLDNSKSELASSRAVAAKLRADLDRLSTLTHPNPAVLSLFPSGTAVRGGAGDASGAAAIESSQPVLVSLGELRSAGPFRIELRTGDRVVQSWEGVNRTTDGDVKLMLTPLAAGNYDFVIGPSGSTYRFRVR